MENKSYSKNEMPRNDASMSKLDRVILELIPRAKLDLDKRQQETYLKQRPYDMSSSTGWIDY